MSDTATLSATSALADRMPDAARDIRLNLQSVLETSSLNEAQRLWGGGGLRHRRP
jgi:hypothetical protein